MKSEVVAVGIFPHPAFAFSSRKQAESGETPESFLNGFCSHGGHQLALNVAVGLQTGGSESYPGVFQPFGGFADDIPVEDGYTRPHDTPGIGIERKPELYALLKQLLD